MSAKKIWVTWLPGDKNQKALHSTIEALQAVGLVVNGAPWIDDLEKSVWTELVDMLTGDDKPDLWLVAGRSEDFSNSRVRYALSLVSANLISLQSETKVFVQNIDGEPIENLPTLLQHWASLENSPGWNAKVVATAFSSDTNKPNLDFHFSMIAHSHIGQWFEVGPAEGEKDWAGAMFGIEKDSGEIAFQAVGERGQLPEKSTNEYPSNGIEAEIGEHEFMACALQNTVSDKQSYYIKVKGFPSVVMFGSEPGSEEAEVHLLRLS